MSALDIIILIAVILIVSLVVYFGFFNKKKSPCKHCSYAKECKEKACLNTDLIKKEEPKDEEKIKAQE